MPAKSFVMAFVLSGWLIVTVVAFMIVAYAACFGVGVIGLMIWFLSARMDTESEANVVGAGLTPGFLAQQMRTKAEMSGAERAALRGRQLLEARSTRFFTYLGVALSVFGFGGFLIFQL